VAAADILKFQSDVVQNIVREVQVTLTPEEQARLTRTRSVNPQALEAYLLGRSYWNKRSPEGMRRALEEFHRAVSIDPQHALAYTGMADTYSVMIGYNLLPAREGIPKAKEAARKALSIDDSLGEAHISLAHVLFEGAELGDAEREFRRGLDLNPGYATGHHWYALHLAAQGRTDEALAAIRQAQQLEPLSSIIRANQAWCLYLGRRYDEAIAQAQRAIDLDPSFSVAHGYLAQALAATGRFDEAITEMAKAAELSGSNVTYRAELATIYGFAGKQAEARQVLGELLAKTKSEYVSPYAIAVIYVALGEDDPAYAWLDKAWDERSVRLVNLKAHPWFDPLRSDARFRNLLRRLGLPE
jgi:tetratricopeptide (TPR) repeat protein